MAIGSSEGDGSTSGALIAVVGPSGAGKDSVIAGVQALVNGDQRIKFPRRVITRQADRTEDNLVVDERTFRGMAERGSFALWWSAHGLNYGVPEELDEDVRMGRVVVVNVSRTIVAQVRNRYTRASVVLIDAPARIRSQRLALRSRESEAQILSRLGRDAAAFDPSSADLVIDNSGPLEESVSKLAAYVSSHLPKSHRQA